MSKFESVQYKDGMPMIDANVAEIDFTLVHGQDHATGVERFTFTPKQHNEGIAEEILPEGIRDHPDSHVHFGVLESRGGVFEYSGPAPKSDLIESMYLRFMNGNTAAEYVYTLKRAKAELGIGRSQPGYLVISPDGLSFYPKETHAKAEVSAIVSGALIAIGGVSAVIRRYHDHNK